MASVGLLPTSVARTQQRSSQRPAFGSSFAKGSGKEFAGRRLQSETAGQAGSARSVTTMASKSEAPAQRKGGMEGGELGRAQCARAGARPGPCMHLMPRGGPGSKGGRPG